MKERDYYSIHCHSEFSNIKVIDSINRYPRSIQYCWDLGLSGCAMTEHDCVSGAIKYIDAFKSFINKIDENPDKTWMEKAIELNFKPILGNEIYLSEEGLNETTANQRAQEGHPGHFYHLILLAKDAEGFKQIRELSSAAWKRAWMKGILRTPTYPSDLFNIVKGGHLICSTACLGGYVANTVRNILESTTEENKQFYLMKLDNHLKMMEKLFGKGNFFIELQPNDNIKGEEQNTFNKWIVEHYWGKYPFVFSTDAHYLNEAEKGTHKAFLNSKSSVDREVDDFYNKAYFMSQDEVKELLMNYSAITEEQFNEMVENTKKISEMCQVYELDQPKVIAKIPYEHLKEYEEDLEIFNDIDKEDYPYLYYYLHTDKEADHYLMELIAHGFVKKYDSKKWNWDEYIKRLEEELWTIKTVGDKINQPMSDYFITMSKLVELMWKAGSLVGPSRGSAGAMLINYLIDITQMNPIEMKLPYVWRFMHPSRPDYPDIDVDSESDKRAIVFNTVRDYFRSLGGDVINVCTFGTEGTKSALKTAARGLNIDDDVISYITSMIPNERGFDWTLHDCYYGDGADKKPISAFIVEMDKYPKLWNLAQAIEGLVTRLGVHASGVVAVNGDFIEHGSYMKTNRGQLVTAYDLHDQERCALLKYDMLTVSALDRIHQCLNYMLEDGVIKWQGSLKETYDKYLSPSVIDFNNYDMWEMADDGRISSLFQFDTSVGGQAIRQIRPHSLHELAIANSVMRLMGEGETPLEKYAKFKSVPQLWYNEMRECGLTGKEVEVLEKYLKVKSGVADTQEVLMLLVVDPQISNFTMEEANKLRKTIAKKKFDEIVLVQKLFYDKGKEQGASLNLLHYVWEKCIVPSLGYSFSEIHTTGYSLIAVQEMNLAYYYPIIYWNCACLSVDSSAINDADFYNLIEDDIIQVQEDVEGKKIANKMDYSRLAAALDKFRNICNIQTPDINVSRLSFTPNVKNNTIIYGLKGINMITDPTIKEIMDNRPFNSLEDFLNKTPSNVVNKAKVINLIKCGAFNNIEHATTEEVLKKYVKLISEPKTKLNMMNGLKLIERGLFPDNLKYNCEVYLLTKELRKHRDKNKLWYQADEINIPIDKVELWRQIVKDSKIQGKNLTLTKGDGEIHEGIWIDSNSWDYFYKNKMEPLKNYISTHMQELLDRFNQISFDEMWNHYCLGDKEQWELDSLNFYFSEHPLKKVLPYLPFEVDRIENIVEGASDGCFLIKGKQIPKMHLYTIAGTVIDRDKIKGTVTLQTIDGVITLKVYKDLYSTMVAVIGNINEETGEKNIEQDSFFEKGVHLLVTGILRGSNFYPKVYKNTGRKSIMRIILDENGNFKGLEEKKSTEEEDE